MRSFSQPVRVTFLTTGLGVGGAETQLVRVVTHLDRRCWAPQVISMTAPGAFGHELDAAGIPLVSLDMRSGFAAPGALFRAIKHLRGDRPEILVCFMFHAIIFGRIAGWMAGVPAIISSIRTGVSGGAWRDRLLRLTDCFGSVTTTNSSAVADSLVERAAVPRSRLRVIPNALSESLSNPTIGDRTTMREALGIAPNEFVWLAVGRFEAAKDYANLIHAFGNVVRHRPEVRLYIAGTGPLQERTHQLVAELDLIHQVRFLGLRKDVPYLLTATDAYVLSSAWEGLPNSLMEALALARPSVATNVGGVAELLIQGRTGLMVEPSNATSLGRAMEQMMEMTPEERSNMGLAGSLVIRDTFALNRVLIMWNELLSEQLESKRS